MKGQAILVAVMVTFILFNSVQATLTDGLISYHPFNGNANDETGNGHDGTVYGATLTPDRFGNPDSAYSFDGIDDSIDVANADTYGVDMSSCSISLWVQIPTNDDLYRNAVTFYGPSIFALVKARSGFEDGRLYTEYSNSSPEAYGIAFSNQTGEELPKNQWLHLVGIADGEQDELRFYIDNVIQESVEIAGAGFQLSTDPTMQLAIGSHPYVTTSYYLGLIDDVRIYNRLLTEREIGALYNIPEPATLLLIGLGGLALLRKP